MLNQRKILRVLQFISYLEQRPPKAVNQLAEMLETTERTVYRYLDLIRECGFDLHRDKNNRFFIHNDTVQGIRFTTEEAEYLKQIVLTTGKKNKLKDAVLSKIYLASDVNIVAGHLEILPSLHLHFKNGSYRIPGWSLPAKLVESRSDAVV